MGLQTLIDTTQHPPRITRLTENTPADLSPSAISLARELLRMPEGSNVATITRKGGRLTIEYVRLVPVDKPIEIGE